MQVNLAARQIGSSLHGARLGHCLVYTAMSSSSALGELLYEAMAGLKAEIMQKALRLGPYRAEKQVPRLAAPGWAWDAGPVWPMQVP